MDISTLFNQLGVSKIALVWKFITGGWAGIAKYLTEKVSTLLKKLPPEKVKEYAELVANIAKFVRYGIELFVKDPVKIDAGTKTATAIQNLADRLADGELTTEELDDSIDDIKAAIEAWRNAKSAK